ncbi:MAG: N-acetyltransferase [Clostridia bacterium]|nr:N-acetyltransferase [Clostridia bacterium]
MEKLNISLAKEEQIDEIMSVYAFARGFMAQTGNPNQWGKTYPEKETLLEDVRNNRLYTVNSGGEIVGAFMFYVGIEPTYKIIRGAWQNDEEYGVIHRVASGGKVKGVFSALLDFCLTKTNHLRIDTHQDNVVMQSVLAKHGFTKCGIIYLANGDERIAYEKTVQ